MWLKQFLNSCGNCHLKSHKVMNNERMQVWTAVSLPLFYRLPQGSHSPNFFMVPASDKHSLQDKHSCDDNFMGCLISVTNSCRKRQMMSFWDPKSRRNSTNVGSRFLCRFWHLPVVFMLFKYFKYFPPFFTKKRLNSVIKPPKNLPAAASNFLFT